MRDYVMIGGVNSADYEIYVADKNQFAAPARDVDIVKVPGLNGTLCLDNGRWENQPLKYLLYIRRNNVENIKAFRAHLMDSSGYKKVQDSFNPDEYYLARFVDAFDVETSDRARAAFEITMDRKPQCYLITGDDVIEVTSSGATIKNPTRFNAKPLIRAYGTGSMTINGATLAISSANIYTDLDCDIQEAYKGSTNCNGNVSGDFPELVPGSNTITFSGFSKLEITPHWYTI